MELACPGVATISKQPPFVNYLAIQDARPIDELVAEFEFSPKTIATLMVACPRIAEYVTGDVQELIGTAIVDLLIYVRGQIAKGFMSQEEADDPKRLLPILRQIARRLYAREASLARKRSVLYLDDLKVEPLDAHDLTGYLESNEFTSKVHRKLLETGVSEARAAAFILFYVYGLASKDIQNCLAQQFDVEVEEPTLQQWRHRDRERLSTSFTKEAEVGA